jgi:Alpha/beta hydrolase family
VWPRWPRIRTVARCSRTWDRCRARRDGCGRRARTGWARSGWPPPTATALGTDAPNAAGLVYVAAFGLDQDESIGGLLSAGPVTPALEHMITDKQGFGWLSEDDFVHHFAGDVEPATATVMYAVQQPLALSAFGAVMGVPAWKSRPAWYLVAGNDEAIPPAAERQFAGRMGATTVEIASGHVAMVSHPDAVADLIKTAAAVTS